MVRHLRLALGGVKKLSVAVLLDQDLRWEGQGKSMQRVLLPPTPEKLAKIRDLIAGIIGFTPERGDKLIVESLPFETTLNAEPPPVEVPVRRRSKDNLLDQVRENSRLLLAGAAGGVLLLVLLAVLFLRRGKAKVSGRNAKLEEILSLPAAESHGAHGAQALPAAAEAVAAAEVGPLEAALPVKGELPEPQPALTAGPQRGLFTRIETLSEEVRDAVDHDTDMCVAILRGWLKEESQ
ncbi:MAG: hypothetical protein NTY38_20055 [Acidobacteria bacterium]|nr:hypothetical protein [Acidobacteriota bacterium]